jgi:DNA-binding NarL/FixJ family response regulator
MTDDHEGWLAEEVDRVIGALAARRRHRADCSAGSGVAAGTARDGEGPRLSAQAARLINRERSIGEHVRAVAVVDRRLDATVKTHVARVLMKLGVRGRVQGVVFAYQSGLVTRDEG